VIDMIGSPALSGTGIDRLVYRDERPVERLHEIGLLAHSTHDSVHVGDPEVRVSQGNHYVNIASAGTPAPADAIEVLHLPWRSWAQYRRKVDNAGRAYLVSGLTPSPNHHGMRDYRRLEAGLLLPYYVTRHPSPEEISERVEDGTLVFDDSLITSGVEGLAGEGIDDELESLARATGLALVANEREISDMRAALEDLRASTEDLGRRVEHARQHVAQLEQVVSATRNRRVVRAADWVSGRIRRAIAR
jgi:hypothetical protein